MVLEWLERLKATRGDTRYHRSFSKAVDSNPGAPASGWPQPQGPQQSMPRISCYIPAYCHPPYTHPFGDHTLASSSQQPVPAEPAFLRPPLCQHCVLAFISNCWTDGRGFCASWVCLLVSGPVRTYPCLDGFVCPMDLHVQAHISRDGTTDEWEIGSFLSSVIL